MKNKVKKALSALLALAITLFAVLPLSSCKRKKNDPLTPSDDPAQREAADKEAELVRSAFSAIDSYREKTVSSLSFTVDGVGYLLKNEGDTAYSGMLASDRFYTAFSEKETLLYGDEVLSTAERCSGFSDGKIYLESDGQKIYSELTAEDYLSYAPVGDRAEFLSSLGDCSLVGFRDEKEGARIVASGFGEEAVAALEEQFSAISDRADGLRVTDASMTVEIDPSHRPVSTEIRVSFSDGKTSLSIRTEYSEWNALPAISGKDLSSFRKTGDLRLLDVAAFDYRQKLVGDTQNFTVTVDTVKTSQTKTLRSVETYAVTSLKNGEGKYIAAIVFDSSAGGHVETNYAKGVKKTAATLTSTGESLGDPIEEAMTDDEARAMVKSYAKIPMPSEMTTVEVTSVDRNTVRFICINPDLSEMKDVDAATVGGSPEAKLEFFYRDGKLHKIVYDVLFDGIDVAQKEYYSYSVTTTLTFND